MEGLASLLPLLLAPQPLAEQQQAELSAELQGQLAQQAQRALLGALRQAVERIARMREASAACLQRLLPAAQAAGVPMASELSAAVDGRPVEEFSSLEALPALAALVAHPPLQEALLEGLTFSIGGLDNQLAQAAGNALAAAVEDQLGEDPAALDQLGSSLLAVWRRHRPAAASAASGSGSGSGGGRMCTPLLLTADLLLSRTGLRDLQAPGSTFTEQARRVGDGRGREGQCCLRVGVALVCTGD